MTSGSELIGDGHEVGPSSAPSSSASARSVIQMGIGGAERFLEDCHVVDVKFWSASACRLHPNWAVITGDSTPTTP